MAQWGQLLERLLTEEFDLFLAIVVLIVALAVGIAIARLLRRLLVNANVPETVEGTPFERTAQRIGTSTVTLLSQLVGLFVLALGVFVALRIIGLLSPQAFVTRFANYLPQVFIAAIVVIVGLILGDKAELATSERLRSVKLSEITTIPPLVKYSVFYVAGLVALAQLGVAVAPLLVLLGAYLFAIVVLGGLAFKDLLSSAAAGFYLLLSEPYSIGDRVEVDGKRGIVQEVDVFVTRIEREGEEYIIPNRQVFRAGIVRVRE